MNKNNLKTAGRQSLALAFACLMVTSMVLMPIGAVGVASAQDDSDNTTQTVVCEPIDGDWWSLMSLDVRGSLSSVYCSASSLFGDTDLPTGVNLAETVYVSHGSIDETNSKMSSDFADAEYDTLAFFEAEKAIVEARYADESSTDARLAGRQAANEEYSVAFESYIEGQKQQWQEIYTGSRATNVDPLTDTVIDVEHQHSFPTTANTQFRVNWEASENSTLEYDIVTLPNGEEVEYVSRITDIDITRNDDVMPDGDRTDVVFAVYGDGFDGGDGAVGVSYEGVTNEEVVDSHTPRVDRLDIRGNDPNGGMDDFRLFNTFSRMDELDSDRANVIDDIDTVQANWYNDVGAGEVPPDEYYGPGEYYTDYGAGMDTSVASQLYFYNTLGYSSTYDATMIVDDSQAGVLEGGIIVDSAESAPLVYDENPLPVSNNGDVVLSSNTHEGVLEFVETGEEDVTETAEITFADGSDIATSDVTIDVLNVDGETVSRDGSNVTATFDKSDMQNENFVLFRAVDESGEDVVESGTYVLFTDELITEVRGFVQGNDYSENYDMLHATGSGDIDRTQLSNSWTLTENYDANGNEQTVAVTHTGVNTDFTGSSAQDRIEAQQDIRDAVDERDDLTAGGGAGDGDGISPLVTGLIGLFGGAVIVFGFGFVLFVLYVAFRLHPAT
ncbi:hypothetical protein [Halorubrum sp. DTA46]|uniref:hypothetical protein n=1 Tax=Halorubrum sp. DTA46 TaxID=3402162 RepID=UPI003AAB5F06